MTVQVGIKNHAAMKKISYIFAAAVLMAASCAKEQNDTSVQMTFTATTESTKTVLAEDNGILWTSEDAITVFAGDNAAGARFGVDQITDGGYSASFTGLADVSPVYYALYPDNNDATISGGVILTTLPIIQQAAAGSFGPRANVSVAKAESDELKFKNIGAILSLKVTESDLTSITLQSLDNSVKMAGKVLVNYNGGEPACTVSEAVDYVTLEGSFEVGKTYYFVVLPGNYASGFAMKFVKGGYSATLENTKALNLARNDSYSLGEITVPAEKWQASVFTPGDEVVIKGLSDAENGQKMTFISSTYYNTSISQAGDNASLAMSSYNYEIFTKISPDNDFFFEDANGVRYGLNADGNAVAPLAPGQTSAFHTVTDSPYRIRLNLPSGEAQVARIGIVNISTYGTSGFSQNLNYDRQGHWYYDGLVLTWGTPSWAQCETRYHFAIWINYLGNNNHDEWVDYGTVDPGEPTSSDPRDSKYWLQPFQGGWDQIFYLGSWLWDANHNSRYMANVHLLMNTQYGHFTHEFTNVVDLMEDTEAGAEMSVNGTGAESGRKFNYITTETFSSPVDAFSENAGADYTYEVFLSLTAGQPVWFERNSKLYSVSGGKVVEIASSADAFTVDADGVYRIRVQMAGGTASVLRIKSARFELSPRNGDQPYDSETLSYEGAGVWAMRNHSLNWQDVDWSWDHYADTRYKLWFTYVLPDNSEVVQAYGHNGIDESRAELSGEHLNLQPVSNDQWTGCKKIPYPVFEGKAHGSVYVDLEVYMNFSQQPGHYTQVWAVR